MNQCQLFCEFHAKDNIKVCKQEIACFSCTRQTSKQGLVEIIEQHRSKKRWQSHDTKINGYAYQNLEK